MHVWHTKPARYFTRGRPAAPTLVVVHCTQGSTAAGAASWFQNPAAGGSAHVVVDDTEVYRCVDDADSAWHAIGHNSFGLGLEIAGFAQWSRSEWLERRPRLTEAARIHAGWCLRYGIPLEVSTRRGYHSHARLPGNDHTDPGAGFPWSFYLAEVNRFLGMRRDSAPMPYGNTLRLRLRVVGAPAPYVDTAGWGPSLPAMRALARNGFARPEKREAIFTWRGGVWRAGGRWGGDPNEIVPRIRTVLNRFAGGF